MDGNLQVIAAGIYVRVSTAQQELENQRGDLARLAAARGWTAEYYEEIVSGVARDRPELARLLDDAKRGRIKAVAVWALDRLGRSMPELVRLVAELDRLGVTLVSFKEPWLDTGGPARDLLLAVMSWVAEQERNRLIERTKAGIDRARRQGKRLGRPPTSTILLHAAADLVHRGVPVAEAARRKGVSRGALRRFLAGRPAC